MATHPKIDQAVMLRRLMNQKGLSSKELATLAGVSPGTISAYLNTPNFTGRINTVKKICHALGVSTLTFQGQPVAREIDRVITMKGLMHEKNISLNELAACSGASGTTLMRYLDNPEFRPRPVTIKKLAACLGVTVEELYGNGRGNIDRVRGNIMQTLLSLNGLLNACTPEERAQARVLFGVWTQHPELEEKCMEDLAALFLKASREGDQPISLDDDADVDAKVDAESTQGSIKD